MQRNDERINKAWIREGTIFFEWKDNKSIEKIHGLYEGAELLQNSYETVIKCFDTKLTNRINRHTNVKIDVKSCMTKGPSNRTRILKTETKTTKNKITTHGCNFIQTPYYSTNSFGFQNPRFLPYFKNSSNKHRVSRKAFLRPRDFNFKS